MTDNTGSTPYSATNNYLANSPLVGQITFANNGTTEMIIAKQYDFLHPVRYASEARWGRPPTGRARLPSPGDASPLSHGVNPVRYTPRPRRLDVFAPAGRRFRWGVGHRLSHGVNPVRYTARRHRLDVLAPADRMFGRGIGRRLSHGVNPVRYTPRRHRLDVFAPADRMFGRGIGHRLSHGVNRLSQISSTVAGTSVVSYAYLYN